jgi:branched-subunit amino acid ABC-type transport system permease component
MQAVANGLVLGSTYGVIALAYTMIYGIIGQVNFAFGGIFMFGAFGALILINTQAVFPHWPLAELPTWFAVLGGLGVGAVIGSLVGLITYRPKKWPPLTSLISSLVVLLILQSIGQFIFGTGDHSYPQLVGGDQIRIGGAVVAPMDLVIVGSGLIALGSLTALVKWTAFGRAMRAVSQNADAASLMGIDTRRVVRTAFALGGALAALSGILFASQYQVANATMGYIPGLKGLVAAVLGGVGNLGGAYLGGMILGILETFTAIYVPQGSAYQDVVAFAILVLILWVRPQGLFGARPAADRA